MSAKQRRGMKRKKEIPEAIGEAFEPGGRAPAPGSLRVVQQFVNTHNHEFDPSRDRLRTPAHARRWLVDHGLLKRRETLTEDDRRWLIAVREAVRTSIMGGSAPETLDEDRMRLTEAARRARLTIDFAATPRARLRSDAGGVHGATGQILAALYDAQAEGTSHRLKTCRQCGWLFFDRSKNRSAEWCSMAICGNRAKNRSYRARLSAKM